MSHKRVAHLKPDLYLIVWQSKLADLVDDASRCWELIDLLVSAMLPQTALLAVDDQAPFHTLFPINKQVQATTSQKRYFSE